MDSVVEIIKLAVENEVRARAFYDKASEISDEGEAQMVFLELVEMESGHAKLLVERFGALLAEQGVDPDALLAGLEDRMRDGPEGEAADRIAAADMREVVEFAIGMEESARENYLSMARHVPEPEMLDLCRELAAEEQSHYDLLSKLRVSMDTPPEERAAL